jgi:pimeloyl-ACP methyl ester carboxylesterase
MGHHHHHNSSSKYCRSRSVARREDEVRRHQRWFVELIHRFGIHNNTTNFHQDTNDPSLLRKHTTYASYTTSTATYPKIRTVYHPHTQASKLPADIPLLVFIHGLGGSSAQFVPLLTSLINAAPCLAIDLPGCGLSEFKPDDVKAYTIKAHAELVAAAVDRHRAVDQKIVLVGHSMGCSIASLLASSTSPLSSVFYDAGHIAGVIAIAPKSSPPSPKQVQLVEKYVRHLPAFVLDLYRFYDNIGGINSASVVRWVGKDADTETRKLQLRYNQQSKSAVFLRYVTALVKTHEDGKSMFPGKEIWSGMKVPLFLVAGEADHVNPPSEIDTISEWLTHQGSKSTDDDTDQPSSPHSAIPPATADLALVEDQLIGHTEEEEEQQQEQHHAPQGPQTAATPGDVLENQHTTQHSFALKTSVFPAPASHALLYSTSTVRILSGLVQTFLSTHCDPRLSLGWQLQHLSVAGKWDVKNLVKWQNTPTISEPIGGVFRAMKTMREVDEEHAPKIFVEKYSSRVLSDGVQTVIDISHENPVYAPAGLEEGGVEYHKFPIVSKLPPTADEVVAFNSLVDRLRESPKMVAAREKGGKPTVGVHCHYGFNRYVGC